MSRSRMLAVVALALPLVARATEAPHNLSNPYEATNCVACHMLHNAPGGTLTAVAGNPNLCQSCHSPVGVGGPSGHGFPWTNGDQATPGKGRSHRWDAPATNLGATPPAAGTPMGDNLSNGSLICSTCHDPHSNAAGAGTAQYSSLGRNVPTTPTSGGTGRTLAITTLSATAPAKGYLVQLVQGGSLAAGLFKLSYDNGTSWFGCSPGTASYPPTYATSDAPNTPTTTNACQTAASVPLDSAGNVVVAFAVTTSFSVGDKWSFYVGYPYLRMANSEGEMCVSCHQDRNHAWQDVEGGTANGVAGGRLASVTLGTTTFSHPVAQGLNANGRSYDRAAPLDANGATQATGDGNTSNDLVLSPTSNVTCLTCHHPHNADSNSLTVNPR